jgi:hypothetical protein
MLIENMNPNIDRADNFNQSDDESKDGKIVSSIDPIIMISIDPADNSNQSDDESKDRKIVSNLDPTTMIDRKPGIVAEIVKDTPKRPTPIQVPIVTNVKTNRLLSKSKLFFVTLFCR